MRYTVTYFTVHDICGRSGIIQIGSIQLLLGGASEAAVWTLIESGRRAIPYSALGMRAWTAPPLAWALARCMARLGPCSTMTTKARNTTKAN